MDKKLYMNKDGKIEFTEKEINKLLDEVWKDGFDCGFSRTVTWRPPYEYGRDKGWWEWWPSWTSTTTGTPFTTDKITITTTGTSENVTLNKNAYTGTGESINGEITK